MNKIKSHSKDLSSKKTIYIALSVILGLLLSVIAHATIETYYLKYMLVNDLEIVWRSNCALPPACVAILPLAGAVLGYFMGRHWWQVVYIEGKGRLLWFRGK